MVDPKHERKDRKEGNGGKPRVGENRLCDSRVELHDSHRQTRVLLLRLQSDIRDILWWKFAAISISEKVSSCKAAPVDQSCYCGGKKRSRKMTRSDFSKFVFTAAKVCFVENHKLLYF